MVNLEDFGERRASGGGYIYRVAIKCKKERKKLTRLNNNEKKMWIIFEINGGWFRDTIISSTTSYMGPWY